MRLFLSALVTALIVPLAAHAQAPKRVEVINDPERSGGRCSDVLEGDGSKQVDHHAGLAAP